MEDQGTSFDAHQGAYDRCEEGSAIVDDILRSGVERSIESRREKGFHASSAGKCYREIIALNLLEFHGTLSLETKRNFAIGHAIHNEVEKYFHDGLKNIRNVLNIGKKRALWLPFGKPGIEVVGEPDIILLDTIEPCLYVIDIKSASSKSFEWMVRKREMWGLDQSYYLSNALQVATYMGGLKQMFYATALQDIPIRGALLYVEKNNLEHRFIDIGGEEKIEGAKMYWKTVQYFVERLITANEAPPAIPRESWQCGYCSLFQSTAKTTATRKKHCLEMCQRADLFELTNMAKQSREE